LFLPKVLFQILQIEDELLYLKNFYHDMHIFSKFMKNKEKTFITISIPALFPRNIFFSFVYRILKIWEELL